MGTRDYKNQGGAMLENTVLQSTFTQKFEMSLHLRVKLGKLVLELASVLHFAVFQVFWYKTENLPLSDFDL